MDGTTDEPEARLRTGLADAEFEALYRWSVGRIYAYVACRVPVPRSAEDLTVQTFAEAWAGRHRYDASQGAPIGWIFGIATNLLRHHRREEETQLLGRATWCRPRRVVRRERRRRSRHGE